ncbi:hypothetical protein EKD04_021555 [Chloroflexales bacterium ZM16-3]|nr:hypothetical protein [Chloroflexales bacterium ZM16-3]
MADQIGQAVNVPAFLQPELDSRLSSWLILVMTHPTTLAQEPEPTLEETGSSIWPTGPEGMPPVALGRLVEQIIVEPRFQSTRKGQSGITKGRLASLKYPGLTEAIARCLMVWFDRAGVLADPEDGQGPWRAPRPFALQDLPLIAQQLRAAPLPSSVDVQAAYGGEG